MSTQTLNRIGGVMVSVLASSVVDCGFIGGVMVSVLASSVVVYWFDPWLDQVKYYEICICYFSAKHGALRLKSKDWYVSEWGNMSTYGLLIQLASTIKIQLRVYM